MKRVIRAVLLFALIGAALNVAVAWACALWSPNYRASTPDFGGVPGEIAHLVSRRSIATRQSMHGCGRSTGLRVHFFFGGRERFYVIQAGWPAAALECDATQDLPSVVAREDVRGWRGGCVPPSFLRGQDRNLPYALGGAARGIPIRPLWPGFALNTLLYASLSWMVIGAPGVLRRYIRQRRGLCLACGYPVAGLKACPECGKAVPARGDEPAAAVVP